MTEAMTSVPWELCEAVVRALTFPCDLMPLKDIVLQIIDRVGGKRESVYGLKVANQCFRYELLELIRSDGTKVQFSKTDCKPPTVCAAPVNPAEAIWVEPREDGPHCVRRPATSPAPPAEPPQSPATTTPPADRQLPAVDKTEPAVRVGPVPPPPEPTPAVESELTSAVELEPEEPEPEELEPKGWQAERVLWFLCKYYPEGKTSRKKTYKDLRAEFAADPEVIEENKRRTRRDPSPEVMSACRRYLGYED